MLIVDDDALIAMDLQEVLITAGHEVCGVAASVPTALDLSEITKPDLAIVDIRLRDGGDGIALAHELHARRGIRSIIVTGLPNDPLVDGRAIVGWLGKPFDPQQLLALIDAHQPPGVRRRSVA